MLADRAALGHGLDEAVGQVPGVRGHEPDTRDAGRARRRRGSRRSPGAGQRCRAGRRAPACDPACAGSQLGEARVGRQVVAVGVDVLAEQRELAIAGLGERLRPRPRCRRRAGCAPGRERRARCSRCRSCRSRRRSEPRPWPRGRGRYAPPRPRRHACPAGDRRRPRLERPTRSKPAAPSCPGVVGPTEAQARGELRLLVGAQEEVDRRVAAREGVLVVGADRAAGEHDAQCRIGLLEVAERAHAPDDLASRRPHGWSRY